MTALDRLGRFSSHTMEPAPNVHGRWHGPLDRLDVRLMVVRNDRTRYLARTAERLREEGLCRRSVTVLPQEHVHHLTALVDCAVQVPLVLAAEEEYLVGVPVATERLTVLSRFGRQLRPERLDPTQHGAVGPIDATLSQQLHHARGGQRMAQVPAHGPQEHVGWPAVTREGRC